MLDTIFGGTSSSRLFQEVRERRGLAYAVYSFTSAYQDTGQVGLYLGHPRRQPDRGAVAVVGTELERLREQAATEEELARAKENLKGRVVLALESTGARMNRLGSEMLAGAPLLSLDEVVERIDAVSQDDLAELVDELWAPGAPVRGRASDPTRSASTRRSRRSRARAASPDEAASVDPGRRRRRGRAHGPDGVRRGRGCAGHGADRARRPGARDARSPTCSAAPTCWSTSRSPTTAVDNAREAVAAGVHVVIGTTGFDPAELRRSDRRERVHRA